MKLYTVGEFATAIGRSQDFVRSLCNKGFITYYRPTGNKRMIPDSAFDELKVNRAPKKRRSKRVLNKENTLKIVPAYKQNSTAI